MAGVWGRSPLVAGSSGGRSPPRGSLWPDPCPQCWGPIWGPRVDNLGNHCFLLGPYWSPFASYLAPIGPCWVLLDYATKVPLWSSLLVPFGPVSFPPSLALADISQPVEEDMLLETILLDDIQNANGMQQVWRIEMGTLWTTGRPL